MLVDKLDEEHPHLPRWIVELEDGTIAPELVAWCVLDSDAVSDPRSEQGPEAVNEGQGVQYVPDDVEEQPVSIVKLEIQGGWS